jgi:hypothetical protein
MPDSYNFITHLVVIARVTVVPIRPIMIWVLSLLIAAVLVGCSAGANDSEERAMGLEDLPIPITVLVLDPGTTRLQVEQAMEGHVMGQGQLMGRYTR